MRIRSAVTILAAWLQLVATQQGSPSLAGGADHHSHSVDGGGHGSPSLGGGRQGPAVPGGGGGQRSKKQNKSAAQFVFVDCGKFERMCDVLCDRLCYVMLIMCDGLFDALIIIVL